MEERRENFKQQMKRPVGLEIEGTEEGVLEKVLGDQVKVKEIKISPEELGWQVESCGAYYA